jgi:uncharacterized protein (DUF924 family)
VAAIGKALPIQAAKEAMGILQQISNVGGTPASAPAASVSDVLDFWFPRGLDADEAAHRRQFQWWFGGGADAGIEARFAPLVEAAAAGALDAWAATPRGRLALIVVLDQFARSLHRGSAEAERFESRAIALALDGLDCADYDRLATVWEKLFFAMPLSRSESLALQKRAVELCDDLLSMAPAHLRRFYLFAAGQARGHRDVVARFGRQPERNERLGRVSTAQERAYLAAADRVHDRVSRQGGFFSPSYFPILRAEQG